MATLLSRSGLDAKEDAVRLVMGKAKLPGPAVYTAVAGSSLRRAIAVIGGVNNIFPDNSFKYLVSADILGEKNRVKLGSVI